MTSVGGDVGSKGTTSVRGEVGVENDEDVGNTMVAAGVLLVPDMLLRLLDDGEGGGCGDVEEGGAALLLIGDTEELDENEEVDVDVALKDCEVEIDVEDELDEIEGPRLGSRDCESERVVVVVIVVKNVVVL